MVSLSPRLEIYTAVLIPHIVFYVYARYLRRLFVKNKIFHTKIRICENINNFVQIRTLGIEALKNALGEDFV